MNDQSPQKLEQADRGTPSSEPPADRLLAYVMLAVAVWGGLLSLGAFLYGMDLAAGKPVFSPNPFRGLIVLGAVSGFLGVWWLALRARRHGK